MPTKVILDVDTGTDDAVALMTAALSPDIELVGATTVNGNTTIDYTTENTLRVFDWIGMPEVPVYRGLDRPLVRSQVARGMATRIHGDLLDLPEVSHGATLQPGHAVDWLIETYLASSGDIVLRPVGPLTNIAMAIQKEPRIVDAIPEIVIMGGAHDHGNMTASAEFNIWLDPEAARVVVNCGRPIRMVPLDATHRALVSTEDAARLRALGTPAGEAAARFVLKRIDGYDATQPMPHRPGAARAGVVRAGRARGGYASRSGGGRYAARGSPRRSTWRWGGRPAGRCGAGGWRPPSPRGAASRRTSLGPGRGTTKV